MTRAFVAAVLAMAGTATGGLIEEHSIDVKTVAAVGSIVATGVWGLSRRFTKIEDRLDSHEHLLKHLACMRVDKCDEPKKKP